VTVQRAWISLNLSAFQLAQDFSFLVTGILQQAQGLITMAGQNQLVIVFLTMNGLYPYAGVIPAYCLHGTIKPQVAFKLPLECLNISGRAAANRSLLRPIVGL